MTFWTVSESPWSNRRPQEPRRSYFYSSRPQRMQGERAAAGAKSRVQVVIQHRKLHGAVDDSDDEDEHRQHEEDEKKRAADAGAHSGDALRPKHVRQNCDDEKGDRQGHEAPGHAVDLG